MLTLSSPYLNLARPFKEALAAKTEVRSLKTPSYPGTVGAHIQLKIPLYEDGCQATETWLQTQRFLQTLTNAILPWHSRCLYPSKDTAEFGRVASHRDLPHRCHLPCCNRTRGGGHIHVLCSLVCGRFQGSWGVWGRGGGKRDPLGPAPAQPHKLAKGPDASQCTFTAHGCFAVWRR